MERSGAAAVVIGSEVLTAKVQDQNGPRLIRRLRDRGIPLRSLEIVPDDVDLIVDAVMRARARARYVFTSGGIGPTHDDLTVRAVALALGRPVVRLAQMERLLEEHHPDGLSEVTLRLAEAPEGTTLLSQEGFWFPVMRVDDGLFLLPGVPQMFRTQLETALRELPGAPVYLRALYLTLRETEFAAALDKVALALPEVGIGSYPVFDPELDYRVKVTFEGNEEAPVVEAVARLRAIIPAGAVVREE
ncbi:MAG: molybdopterin-binding protein [Myxococcaceae bacterium]|nr:molybdopterin-binding protein [Myxococcaceae bacterium]MCI0672244.1 molybdopterin-binding protein [Myxococcaceae bacterium]